MKVLGLGGVIIHVRAEAVSVCGRRAPSLTSPVIYQCTSPFAKAFGFFLIDFYDNLKLCIMIIWKRRNA